MTTIRKARLSDVHALSLLWKEMASYHETLLKEDPETRQVIFERKKEWSSIQAVHLKKLVRSSNCLVIVAEAGDDLVGFSIAEIKRNVPVFKVEKVGYISDLFVKEGFRKTGIASMLKDESFRWLRNKGIRYVSLKMFKGNRIAHQVYRKWGFSDFDTIMWTMI